MRRNTSIGLVLLMLFTSIGPVAATDRQKGSFRLDEEVKFRGTAIEYFSQIGAWGWNVSVDAIISGPSEILGHTVAVYLAPVPFPPGYMDPSIEPGDAVEVYGLYQGYDNVALFGSAAYYIIKVTDTTPPSITNIRESNDPINTEGCPEPTTVIIRADVTDESGVALVELAYYSTSGFWYDAPMLLESGNTYKATIGPFDLPGTLNYYVSAMDNEGNETQSSTRTVTVDDCSTPPGETIITSVQFDYEHYYDITSQYLYKFGEDTVTVRVDVHSTDGGTFRVGGQVTDFRGTATELPSQIVTLFAGESKSVTLSWDVPDNALPLDYNMELTLSDYASGEIVYTHPTVVNAFVVTQVSIDEVKNATSECLSWEGACALRAAGLIPYVGIPANIGSVGDTACQFNEKAKQGLYVEAAAKLVVLIVDFVVVLKDVVTSFAPAAHVGVQAFDVWWASITCAETIIDDASGQGIVKGAAEDAAYEEFIHEFFTYLAREQVLGVSIHDSGSNGGAGNEIHSNQGSTLAAVTANIGVTDGAGGFAGIDESGNPSSTMGAWPFRIGERGQLCLVKDFSAWCKASVSGTAAGVIDMDILFPRSDGSAILLTYDEVSTAADSEAFIMATHDNIDYTLNVDIDGDGTTDYTLAPSSVEVISFQAHVPLISGWNLISFNVTPPDTRVSSVLETIDGLYTVVRGYDQGALSYYPDLPPEMNSLKNLDPYHGYWIKMTAPANLTVEGIQVAAGTPLSLREGWNLVSYLPDVAMPVAQALASVDGLYTVVRGYDGGALSYYPDLPPEMNSLKNLEPQHGYWIKLTQPATLIYP